MSKPFAFVLFHLEFLPNFYVYRFFRFAGSDGISGFGFELTFRLRRETGETSPPTWPASLLQSLARYVFKSGAH